MICKRVGRGERSSSAAFDRDVVERERGPRAASRRASRRRDRAGPPSRLRAPTVVADRVERSRRDDPPAEVRVAALAGERLEVVGGDPAPLGDQRDRPSGPGRASTPARTGATLERSRRRRRSRPGRSRGARTGRRAAAAARSGCGGARSPRLPGAMRVARRSRGAAPGCSPEPIVQRRTRRDATRRGRARPSTSELGVEHALAGRQRDGCTTASPRAIASCSTPARLSATRLPGPIRSTRAVEASGARGRAPAMARLRRRPRRRRRARRR